jgi:hypothetical protein
MKAYLVAALVAGTVLAMPISPPRATSTRRPRTTMRWRC